jgi:uncharacterized protein (TIGR03437 family)
MTRGRNRRLAWLVALALIPALTAADPAGALNFEITNAASFESGPVPRGALLAIFTDVRVTDETVTTAFPWPDSAGGVSVETNACTPGGPAKRLPILFVGPSGNGTQINVYYPNDFNPGLEVFGTCAGAGGQETMTVTPKAGFGAPIAKTIETVPARPALFQSGDAPDGRHLDAVTGAATPFTTCNADPKRCPVASSGQPNYLIVNTTGAEIWSCPVPALACNGNPRISFRLTPAGGQPREQPLEFLGYVGTLGREQANVRLAAGTAPGEHRLSVRIPASASLPSAQELLVRLGPAVGSAAPGPPAAPGPAATPFLPIVRSGYRTRGPFTRFVLLRVRDLPAGTRVELLCRGRGCAFRNRRFAPRARRVNVLPALKRRWLRAGARLEVKAIGPRGERKVVRFRMRRGKAPRRTVRCAPPLRPLGRCP